MQSPLGFVKQVTEGLFLCVLWPIFQFYYYQKTETSPCITNLQQNVTVTATKSANIEFIAGVMAGCHSSGISISNTPVQAFAWSWFLLPQGRQCSCACGCLATEILQWGWFFWAFGLSQYFAKEKKIREKNVRKWSWKNISKNLRYFCGPHAELWALILQPGPLISTPGQCGNPKT